MRNFKLLLSFLTLPFACMLPPAHAQGTASSTEQKFEEKLSFRSSFGRFQIEKRNGKYFLEDNVIEIPTFKSFLTLFDQKFTEDCKSPADKKLTPDLRVTRTIPPVIDTEKASITHRYFYIESHQVGDGSKCIEVTGAAIYYLPLHSSWYAENKKASLNFGETWSLKKGDQLLGQFKRQNNEWTYQDENQFVDWEFVNRFIRSLESFTIDTRVHPALIKQPADLILTTAAGDYELFSMGNNIWMLKSPRLGWLLSSASWGFWQDMGDNLWFDRFKPRLTLILDKDKEIKERKETILGLGDFWNKNIQSSLQKLLLDSNEPLDLRLTSLALLKRKPSLDNFSTMIDVLSQTSEIELQSELTKALRVRNPKGPLITDSDEDLARTEKTREWVKWWQTQKTSKK